MSEKDLALLLLTPEALNNLTQRRILESINHGFTNFLISPELSQHAVEDLMAAIHARGWYARRARLYGPILTDAGIRISQVPFKHLCSWSCRLWGC